MKKFLVFISIIFSIIAFKSCVIDYTENHYLYIKVHPYEIGKKYGLYIVNRNNVIIKANEPIVILKDGEATFKDKVIKFENAKNSYFLYYPYSLKPDSMPSEGDTIITKDPKEFFKTLENVKVARGVENICGEFMENFEMVDL